MNREEYKKQLNSDPDYIAAKKELKPLINLANNILRLRLARGWSQAELAQRVGTKQSNISKIESGFGNPTYKFLCKIAEAFDEELNITVGERIDDAQIQMITVEVPVPFENRTRYYLPVHADDLFTRSEERVNG